MTYIFTALNKKTLQHEKLIATACNNETAYKQLKKEYKDYLIYKYADNMKTQKRENKR